MMMSAATTVEGYLESLPEEARAVLGRLREAIRSVAPEATEAISYRIPIFRYHGDLVGISAHKNHYSLHVMSTAVMDAHRDDLAPFTTTTATVHFSYDRPLPASLVEKLVSARVRENAERARERRGPRARSAPGR